MGIGSPPLRQLALRTLTFALFVVAGAPPALGDDGLAVPTSAGTTLQAATTAAAVAPAVDPAPVAPVEPAASVPPSASTLSIHRRPPTPRSLVPDRGRPERGHSRHPRSAVPAPAPPLPDAPQPTGLAAPGGASPGDGILLLLICALAVSAFRLRPRRLDFSLLRRQGVPSPGVFVHRLERPG